MVFVIDAFARRSTVTPPAAGASCNVNPFSLLPPPAIHSALHFAESSAAGLYRHEGPAAILIQCNYIFHNITILFICHICIMSKDMVRIGGIYP